MTFPRPLSLALPLLAALLLGACADTNDFDPGDTDDASVPTADLQMSCTEGQTRCVGQEYQECLKGLFRRKYLCKSPQVCAPKLGCADCDPALGGACQGNVLYTCDQNGKIGAKKKDCLGLSCSAGDCRAPSCAFGSRLIYVVDTDYRLLSFDPAAESDHFKLIAKLSCPAGSPWPFRPAPASPFSMSVDRSARAWILYTSGEVFWVDTKTGACKAAPFQKGQHDFKLFGMGFVADAKGSNAEKLYVANSRESTTTPDTLGYIDPGTMTLQQIGPLTKAEYSAELTGTGNAELYAYHPGTSSTFVAQVDKTTGKVVKQWKVSSLGGQVMAWAFAHWGGRFYIFVTVAEGMFGTERSMVLRLNPSTGSTTTFLNNIKYKIVGAGVSTCAPVIE